MSENTVTPSTPRVRWTWNPFAVWFKPDPTEADLFIDACRRLDKEIDAAERELVRKRHRRGQLVETVKQFIHQEQA